MCECVSHCCISLCRSLDVWIEKRNASPSSFWSFYPHTPRVISTNSETPKNTQIRLQVERSFPLNHWVERMWQIFTMTWGTESEWENKIFLLARHIQLRERERKKKKTTWGMQRCCWMVNEAVAASHSIKLHACHQFERRAHLISQSNLNKSQWREREH